MSSFLLVFTLIAPLLSKPPPAPIQAPVALAQSQEKIFRQVAREEFCGCNSSLTIAGCLQLRPTCSIAKQLAEGIARSSRSGNDADQILSDLSSRVLGPYCSAPKKMQLPEAPSKGNAAAEITIVEFADFRCGHCKQAAPSVSAALRTYGKQARLIFIPYPLGTHPASLAAAKASLAAHQQGKFWAMHDRLFQYQADGFSQTQLFAHARALKLNLETFKRDLNSPQIAATIQAYKQFGASLGISGTPSFFINGRPFRPDPNVLTPQQRIAMELARNQGTCQ